MPKKQSPALDAAVDIGRAAAARGFDWEDPRDALDKVVEEVEELREAIDERHGEGRLAEELGDLLFAVCNVARMVEISPEQALRDAAEKFQQRFSFLLAALARDGLRPEDLPLVTLERYWQEAKDADLP